MIDLSNLTDERGTFKPSPDCAFCGGRGTVENPSVELRLEAGAQCPCWLPPGLAEWRRKIDEEEDGCRSVRALATLFERAGAYLRSELEHAAQIKRDREAAARARVNMEDRHLWEASDEAHG